MVGGNKEEIVKTVYVYMKHERSTYKSVVTTNKETGEIEEISIISENPIMLASKELSDIEGFCMDHEDWDILIGKANSITELEKILSKQNLEQHLHEELLQEYEEIINKDYKSEIIRKEKKQVGLFFCIDGRFAFSGCSISKAENYGDFLIYPESHYDVWEHYKYLNDSNTIPYDYYPRGRIVYRKSDDTFIIYYDKCVENEIGRIASYYDGYAVRCELDEHYCCHKCNPDYVM